MYIVLSFTFVDSLIYSHLSYELKCDAEHMLNVEN